MRKSKKDALHLLLAVTILCAAILIYCEYFEYGLLRRWSLIYSSREHKLASDSFDVYSLLGNNTHQSIPIKSSTALRAELRNDDVVEKWLDFEELTSLQEDYDNQAESKDKLYMKSWNKTGSAYYRKKYGNFSKRCKDPDSRMQDLFCLNKLSYLRKLKNPCWFEKGQLNVDSLRCLPYYHILGCAKCATTDLYQRLTSHPQILKNNAFLEKETLWWSWSKYGIYNYKVVMKKSFENYISNFDNTAEYIMDSLKKGSDLANKVITGDASPPDFWDFRAWPLIPQNEGLKEPKVLTPHLMQYVYRNPKFILLLRNPTERLYSDYFFLKQGENPENFHEDVISSLYVIMDCLSTHTERHCFFSSKIFSKLKCRLHFGCYVLFLKEWLNVFHRDHFYIARTEDYSKDIEKHLAEMYKFLQVDPLSPDKLEIIEGQEKERVTDRKKKFPFMFSKTRDVLDKFYEKYNQRLAEVLGSKNYVWPESSSFNKLREKSLEIFKANRYWT